MGLTEYMHEAKLIHKDLHGGNILNNGIEHKISDFGFCMPTNGVKSNSTKKNVYGVFPYEILRGKPYTRASDIYSLGIIVNEIIAVVPPFNNQPHDFFLALDICRGLRPPIRTETPKFLKELIKECWDAIPKNRPTSGKIINILHDHIKKKQIEELEELSYDFNESTNSQLYETHPQTIYTSRLLKFQNLPKPGSTKICIFKKSSKR